MLRLHSSVAPTLLLSLSACASPASDIPADPEPPSKADETIPRAPGVGPGPLPLSAVRINEVVSSNHAGLQDADGDEVDWIELYNDGLTSVSLEGFGLSDDPDLPLAWTFPDLTLPPGDFLLVFASGKGESGPPGELHTPFKVDADGETLLLSNPSGGELHRLEVPALGEDWSFGAGQPIAATFPLLERKLDASPEARARHLAWLKENPSPGWQNEPFKPESWRQILLPAGYDTEKFGAGTPENVALFQQASQSSDGYGYTGAQGNDGELATFTHTNDGDLDSWWEVNLGGEFALSRIELHNRQECCPERLYNVTVGVWNSGVEVYESEVLNPVAEGGTPADPGGLLAVEGEWTGDTVRVSKTAVNGAYSSEWLSLAEVVALGVPAAPYADQLLGPVSTGTDIVALWMPFRGGEADRALLDLWVDDGVIAWVDGQEVARAHVGANGEVEAHEAELAERFAVDPTRVGPGEHVLALEVHSVDVDDLLIDVALTLQTLGSGKSSWFPEPTPGEANGAGYQGVVAAPQAVPPRGFYDEPAVVTLTSPTPDAVLHYSLDGRPPSEGSTVVPAPGATASVTLQIAANTLLRASAVRENWADSPVVTNTYLFLEQVIHQPGAPVGWPLVWDDPAQGPFSADYEMDPEVVTNPAYHDDLLAGLREIPTLSLVFEPDSLFGPEGIYVHSLERGDDSEVPVSAEWILPDGSTGFAVDCGLRLHGYGWRYHSATLKHAFRLEFKGEYGPRKLEYPLFADSTAERFDNIVLRAQGSRGFQDFRDPEQSDYIRDAFARDTARDMGKLDGHATFAHLYLNGLYWGLYNPVERPDAGFGEEYLGGESEDYDAINRRTSTNEAIDGDLLSYNEMLALADADLSDPVQYEALSEYLDMNALIDYMLIHQYTVNRDGPCCYESNNMRGIRRRAEGEGFQFYVWDMEYSIWEATDSTNIDIDVAGSISHVYTRLRDNEDFRLAYATRAASLLGPGGALSPEASSERWLARADEIRNAIVAESARWGDARREPPYTRDVEWEEEQRRILEEYFPYRSDEMLEQLEEAGLGL